MPKAEDMIKLLEVLQDPSFKNVGFIIGLKRIERTEPIYEKLTQLTIPNLKVEEFVP